MNNMRKRFFIFLCNNNTLPEVVEKRIVGHRYRNYIPMMELINKDDLFLLYNYDAKVFIDILKATGERGLHHPIESKAFKGKFPYQARFSESIIPQTFRDKLLPKEKVLNVIHFTGEYPQFVLDTQKFNLLIKIWSEYSKSTPLKFEDYEQYGYIFLCNNTTASECLDKKVFGAKDSVWQDFISRIQIGSPCFLWNYQKQELYGIFRAVSFPYYDRERRNFNGNYPAQVKVDWIEEIKTPLKIQELKSIINFKEHPPIQISSEVSQRIINKFNTLTVKIDRQSREFLASDGHIVKSQGELIIDNLLYQYKLIHAYGIRVPIADKIIFTDFYLPEGDVYIEYWGGMSTMEQEKLKKDWYEKNKKKLISIYPKDIELGISDKLKMELLNFGYNF